MARASRPRGSKISSISRNGGRIGASGCAPSRFYRAARDARRKRRFGRRFRGLTHHIKGAIGADMDGSAYLYVSCAGRHCCIDDRSSTRPEQDRSCTPWGFHQRAIMLARQATAWFARLARLACAVAGAAAGAPRRASSRRIMRPRSPALRSARAPGRIEIGDDGYSAAAQGATAGLLKAFSGGTGSGSAQGRIVNGALVPRSYTASINSKKSETIQHQSRRRQCEGFLDRPGTAGRSRPHRGHARRTRRAWSIR